MAFVPLRQAANWWPKPPMFRNFQMISPPSPKIPMSPSPQSPALARATATAHCQQLQKFQRAPPSLTRRPRPPTFFFHPFGIVYELVCYCSYSVVWFVRWNFLPFVQR